MSRWKDLYGVLIEIAPGVFEDSEPLDEAGTLLRLRALRTGGGYAAARRRLLPRHAGARSVAGPVKEKPYAR